MQKSAENCKELGIRKLLQEFCGMLKVVPHALLLAEARGGGFNRFAHSAGPWIVRVRARASLVVDAKACRADRDIAAQRRK